MWNTISALLPTKVNSFEAISRALQQRNLRFTDDDILTADFGNIICKLELFKRNEDWLNTIYRGRGGIPFKQHVIDELAHTSVFVHFEAPNDQCKQNIDSQSGIALDAFQFIHHIMQALSVPAVLVRCSNQIHTLDEYAELAQNLSAQHLVYAFTRIWNIDGVITVAGMQALGQPNIEFPPNLLPLNTALNLISELSIDLVKRDEVAREGLITYTSKETGKVYELQLTRDQSGSNATVLESNPIGTLRLRRLVGV